MLRADYTSGRIHRGFLAVLAFLLMVGLAAQTSGAQTSEELEDIRQERKEAQKEAAAQAAEVDAQQAELDELTEVLEILQANVNAQEGRVAEAKRKLDDAEARHATSMEAVAEKQSEIVDLREQLADRAISSFIGQNEATSALVGSAGPNEAIRMKSLVESVNRDEADLAERLKAAEEDLEIERSLAEVAALEADQFRAEEEAELADLDDARNLQAEFTEAAETKLDSLLVRQAELDARVNQLTAAEKKEKARLEAEAKRLAEELARKRAPKPSGGGGGGPVSPDSIVNACGFRVHKSIQTATCNMVNAAAAAGISLGGGGYRSSASQIALRKAHCGTSQYAIWEMPASRCRPPTARPGRSNHEKGLAIDFTYNGRSIGSHSNAAYKWLAANAASYGFYNLPSEPWHWSVNGN